MATQMMKQVELNIFVQEPENELVEQDNDQNDHKDVNERHADDGKELDDELLGGGKEEEDEDDFDNEDAQTVIYKSPFSSPGFVFPIILATK